VSQSLNETVNIIVLRQLTVTRYLEKKVNSVTSLRQTDNTVTRFRQEDKNVTRFRQVDYKPIRLISDVTV
jgi:hypothetical protein